MITCFDSLTSFAAQINIYQNNSFLYPTTRRMIPKGKINSTTGLVEGNDEWKEYRIYWGDNTNYESCDYDSRRNIYIPANVYNNIKVGDYFEFTYYIEHNPYLDWSSRHLTFDISGALTAHTTIEFPYGGGQGTAKVYITGKPSSTISSDRVYRGSTYKRDYDISGYKVTIKLDISSSTVDGQAGNGSAVWIWSAKAKGSGYTISYNANGGSSTPTKAESVERVTLPSVSRTGYTFAGWYNGNAKAGNAGETYTPSSDVTLTAHWTPRTDTKYVVRHQLMNVTGSGYTVTETETLKGTTDSSITPATKTYTGFTAPSKQTVTIAADGSRIVTYSYSRNKYTFTIGSETTRYSHGINTSGSSASGSYYYGATITLVASPKAGYTWQKWSDGNTSQNRTFTMPANNLTITPTASLITYTIRYNTYEGNLQKEKAITYNVESPDIVLENPTLNGKEFLGWSDWNDPTPKKPYTIPKGSTGDLIISANWNTNTVDPIYTGESRIKANRFTINI